MPVVYESPFSGQAEALQRVRRAAMPPGGPQRAYIDFSLPRAVLEAQLVGWRFVGEGADQARRGYARDTLRTLHDLGALAATQGRLPAPTL